MTVEISVTRDSKGLMIPGLRAMWLTLKSVMRVWNFSIQDGNEDDDRKAFVSSGFQSAAWTLESSSLVVQGCHLLETRYPPD